MAVEMLLKQLSRTDMREWTEQEIFMAKTHMAIAIELQEIKEILAQNLADRKKEEELLERSSIPDANVEGIGRTQLPEGFK